MEKKDKKGLSPKAKKIISIVVTSLQVAIVVVTVVISIFVWTTTGRGEPESKAMQILAIRSNSMSGDKPDSFNAGDLVIVKAPESPNELEVGTIITFKKFVPGGVTLITHRIFEVVNPTDAANARYVTKGDNVSDVDSETVHPGDIVGVYSFKIKVLGGAMLWLQGYERVPTQSGYGWDYAGNTNNFLWVIIIPLIALLLWNGYSLIKVIVDGKLKKAREEAVAMAAASKSAELDAEEIKRRAIEEYLAELNKAQAPTATAQEEVSAQVADGGTADTSSKTIPEQNSPELAADTSETTPEQSSPESADTPKPAPKQNSPESADTPKPAPKQNSPFIKGGLIDAKGDNGGFDNSIDNLTQPTIKVANDTAKPKAKAKATTAKTTPKATTAKATTTKATTAKATTAKATTPKAKADTTAKTTASKAKADSKPKASGKSNKTT